MEEENLQRFSTLDPLDPLQEPSSSLLLASRRSSAKTTPEGCSEVSSNAELNAEKGASSGDDSDKSHAISAKYVAYLGCIKDNWSSCHAAKLLDEELISYLRPRFVLLSTPLKVRVLTSLLYIKADLVCSTLWRTRRLSLSHLGVVLRFLVHYGSVRHKLLVSF